MKIDTAAPRRRWYSFSLRTLFVLVTVLGVFLGWLAVQVKWIRDRHEVMSRPGDRLHGYLGQTKAPWSIRIFGEQGHEWVFAPYSEMDRMHALFPEAQVMPDRWPVSD